MEKQNNEANANNGAIEDNAKGHESQHCCGFRSRACGNGQASEGCCKRRPRRLIAGIVLLLLAGCVVFHTVGKAHHGFHAWEHGAPTIEKSSAAKAQ